MADAAPVVHIGENSPEYVAYQLMDAIAKCEGLVLYRASGTGPSQGATRKWVLDTYSECLEAVRGLRSVE